MAWLCGRIVGIARGPRHAVLRSVKRRLCCSYSLALLVENRGLLNCECDRLYSGFNALAKLQIEQTREEPFAGNVCAECQGVRTGLSRLVGVCFVDQCTRSAKL